MSATPLNSPAPTARGNWLTQHMLIGIAAGVGGIAPNLVNLGQTFMGTTPNPPGALYYVGVGIFFVMGAIVALIFSETDHRKAFFLGISLPAFIAAAQTQSPPKVNTTSASAPILAIFDFIPSAHAQPSALSSGRLIDAPKAATSINLKSTAECKDCEISFFDGKGKLIEKKIIPKLKDTTSVSIPKGAVQFGVWNDKINPKVVTLPKESAGPVTVEFDTKYNAWNDLKRGLGNYDLRSYDSQLKAVTTVAAGDAKTRIQ